MDDKPKVVSVEELDRMLSADGLEVAAEHSWTWADEEARLRARIAELERDLKSVLDRESATIARYDARIAELERERDAEAQAAYEAAQLVVKWSDRAREAEARADRLAALLKEAGEALDDIARQKKTDELETEYDVEVADFEAGYDMCIDRARATLARMKEETDGRE